MCRLCNIKRCDINKDIFFNILCFSFISETIYELFLKQTDEHSKYNGECLSQTLKNSKYCTLNILQHHKF